MRWLRVGLLSGLLALVLGLTYLNRVGLPGFLAELVESQLRARGVDVEFERLRLRFHRGLVADEVRVIPGSKDDADIEIGELCILPDWGGLLRLETGIRGLAVEKGRVSIEVGDLDSGSMPLVLENVRIGLEFQPGDRWRFTEVSGQCFGASVNLSGSLTNVLAWRGIFSRDGQSARASYWRLQARRFMELMEQLDFERAPEVTVWFQGNAGDPTSIRAALRLDARRGFDKHFSFQNLHLTARTGTSRDASERFDTNVELRLEQAWSDWINLRGLQASLRIDHSAGQLLPAAIDITCRVAEASRVDAKMEDLLLTASSRRLPEAPGQWETTADLTVGSADSHWFSGQSNSVSALVVHSLANRPPQRSRFQVRLGKPRTPWGQADSVEIIGSTQNDNQESTLAVPAPEGWWRDWVAAGRIDAQVSGEAIRYGDARLDRLVLAGGWRSPELEVSQVLAELYDGTLRLPALRWDTATRELDLTVQSSIDLLQLRPLLPEELRTAWADIAWETPPTIETKLTLTLPEDQGDKPLDWNRALRQADLKTTVRGGPMSYHGFEVTDVEAAFRLADSSLLVEKFRVGRDEGALDLRGRLDLETQEFLAEIESRIDVDDLRLLLPPSAHKPFDLFELRLPPSISGEVRGRGGNLDELRVAARVALTNFTFRGEPCDTFQAEVSFVDRFVTGKKVELRLGEEWVEAEGVGFDTRRQWLYLTNAHSRILPQRVTRAIGPQPTKTLAPYRFEEPPLSMVNGRVPTRGSVAAADMKFEVTGGPFQYWRFRLPRVTSTVHWTGEHLSVTNLVADFYGGRLELDLEAAIQTGGDVDLQFQAGIADVDLNTFTTDVFALRTNRLAGVLNADLEVTHANSADWGSWQGGGQARLRDGFLLDFPLYAMFSSMANAITPGTGNTKATAATAAFKLEDSIIRTEDLIMRADPVALWFRGTTDFQGRLAATVEAQLLPGAPFLGDFVSFMLTPLRKMLIYKVTGTIAEPTAIPLLLSTTRKGPRAPSALDTRRPR